MKSDIFKNVFVPVCIFVFTLAAGLGIAEMVLRVKNSSMKNYDIEMWKYAKELKKRSSDEILGHEHVPNSESVLESVNIRINERGMRGAPVMSPPPARRILFLGSSITLGWGVEEQDTVTSLLAKKLTAEGQSVEVLNAGIGNYNAKRYTHLFLTRLTDLAPTDIVINYFINDVEVLQPGGANALVRNSQLAATIVTAYNMLISSGKMEDLVDHYRKLYSPSSQGYREMVESLDLIADYASSHHIRVYFLMTPDIHQLHNYPFRFIHNEMKRLAAKRGFIYIDPLESFLSRKPEELWAMPGDPHPNALGHRLMAEAMYDAMSQGQ